MEDSSKVRGHEQSIRRFRTAWVRGNQKEFPAAPFTFSKKECQLSNKHACPVLVPSRFDWQSETNISQVSTVEISSVETGFM